MIGAFIAEAVIVHASAMEDRATAMQADAVGDVERLASLELLERATTLMRADGRTAWAAAPSLAEQAREFARGIGQDLDERSRP